MLPRPVRRRPDRPSEHGAALVVVMVAIALLTALAVDLAYEARVRLQIAANGRDELRATALAKSAVNLSRLVLAFQHQVDGATDQAARTLGSMGGLGSAGGARSPTTPGAPGGQGGAPTGLPRPQLWSLIPIESGLVAALFEDGGRESEGAPPSTLSFGDFDGGFAAKIEDEGSKVNMQFGALVNSGRLAPQAEALLRLVCDTRWDPLFDREDANGQRWTRADLPVQLRNWVDDSEGSWSLLASFPGGNCSAVVLGNGFEKGFGDKNFPYDRGPDRYRTKNARLDSLQELHMVAGIGDLFMAAFGDRLTVYLPNDGQMNVNTSDPRDEIRIALLMADPAFIPQILDPEFQIKFHKALSEARMGGLLAVSPMDFANLLQGFGVAVKGDYLTQGPRYPFTDKSIAFRIRAKGQSGAVEKTIDAVVTYDQTQNPDAQAGQLSPGALIHWREE